MSGLKAALIATVALCGIGGGGWTASAGTFPWKPGETPPTVAGLALGDTEQHAREVLGNPESVDKSGSATVLEYKKKGLQVLVTPEDGIAIIRLRSPEAGTIDGLQIGDRDLQVVGRWGPPDQTDGRTAFYNAGIWTITVRLADKAPQIADLMLGWNQKKDPIPPPPNPAQPAKPGAAPSGAPAPGKGQVSRTR